MLQLVWMFCWNVVLFLVVGLIFVGSTVIGLLALFAVFLRVRKWSSNKLRRRTSVGFFHPYCLAGGGGERVLWAAIRSLEASHSCDFIIYTGDDLDKCKDFRKHALDRFKIEITEDTRIHFVQLPRRTLLEARHYPVLTMIFQSLGSILVGLEGLWGENPDIFIDTTGYAFTIPFFRVLGGCRTAAYVHYPTISTDMLSRVKERRPTYNNAETVSRSAFLSSTKLLYYRIFAFLYGCCGRLCEVTLVNSTWTYNHIKEIWGKKPVVVYPPCNVTDFLSLPLLPDESKERISIVSIGQFRPEKDHPLQLHALAALSFLLPQDMKERIQLDFVGSCRNSEDYKRVEELQALAEKLMVKHLVKYHLNVPFPELLKICQHGTIGIHTMWNEHFGIGVVECLAAGLLTVAHDSGGPKSDIINVSPGERTGYLASDTESYARAMRDIIFLGHEERNGIRQRARHSTKRFSDQQFDDNFEQAVKPLFSVSH